MYELRLRVAIVVGCVPGFGFRFKSGHEICPSWLTSQETRCNPGNLIVGED